jgi:hypothetical protein
VDCRWWERHRRDRADHLEDGHKAVLTGSAPTFVTRRRHSARDVACDVHERHVARTRVSQLGDERVTIIDTPPGDSARVLAGHAALTAAQPRASLEPLNQEPPRVPEAVLEE